MFKQLLFFLLFASLAFASSKVEIFATSVQTQNDIVEASGDVVVSYQDYLLSAKKATYNRKNGDLELFGDITMSYGKNYRVIGNYARLNLEKKEKIFHPFYILDKKTDVWISAQEGSAKKDDMEVKNGIVSGCDQNNPLWKLEFTSSNYNTQTKWINLYNTTLYFYDIPVLYTPYFGYSLDTTRRTGLLLPAFGISTAEGFYFQQPFYIAEYDSWDLELKPQIRTIRGSGIYSKLRFVDSPSSQGYLKAGYFKENSKYYKDNNLANQEHYGYNFHYTHRGVLQHWFNAKLDGQSGLFVDINNMNDVDYINLETNNEVTNQTSTQVLSRINLFYNTNFNYYATYLKYHLDLTKNTNVDTLQQLPILHYHHYLDTFFNQEYFNYSLDARSTNIYREAGTKTLQTQLNLPVKLQTSVFDELLNLSYTTTLYAQHSHFTFDSFSLATNLDDGYFLRDSNSFSASIELAKGYEDFIHTLSFGVIYTQSSFTKKSGYYETYGTFCSNPINATNPICEAYTIENIDESLELNLQNYIYDGKAKPLLYHKLAQKIDYTQSQNRFGELESELRFNINRWFIFYNDTLFNFDEKGFSKSLNSIKYDDKTFDVTLSYLYKDSFIPSTPTLPRYTRYVTSKGRYRYNSHYSYEIGYNYDLEAKVKKSGEIGFLYRKRCWDFGIKYMQNNRPILTQTGESSINDKYIYFTIVLKPLMPPAKPGSSNIAVKLPE